MVQFTGVDQVEALLAHVFESRNDLSCEGLHAIGVSFVTGEVEIEMLAGESVRHERASDTRGMLKSAHPCSRHRVQRSLAALAQVGN